ncbi:MAG: hypothetical protein HYT49_01690 [Candidatus Wildermuthbacteria bacterium]|nr:hypothetical protein [Candidatus Wildermuthbacteria bacterium]
MMPEIRRFTEEEFRRKLADRAYIHILGLFEPRQLGVMLFLTRLEFFHYPPGSARNSLFELLAVNWQEMLWVGACIPSPEITIARRVAAESGLRVTHSGRALLFLLYENVFLLESIPHLQDFSSTAERLRAEEREIQRIQAGRAARN